MARRAWEDCCLEVCRLRLCAGLMVCVVGSHPRAAMDLPLCLCRLSEEASLQLKGDRSRKKEWRLEDVAGGSLADQNFLCSASKVVLLCLLVSVGVVFFRAVQFLHCN